MERLPAYVWPPLSWIEAARAAVRFEVGYPRRLPKGACFTRYRITEGRWLSIPIQHALRTAPLQASWPLESRWRLYHWRTILTLYGKAPFFYEWKPFLEYLYLDAPLTSLRDVADLILKELGRVYGWRFQWVEEPLSLPKLPSYADEMSGLERVLRLGA